METKSHTIERGRSPKSVSESRADHVVVPQGAYNLDDMLAQITSENLHPEWDTGPSQGAEEW